MTHAPGPGVGADRLEKVAPFGPVFLSYRQSDGLESARELAWALRSAGVPVWHDLADLPPGDLDQRLAEALASGLSGAVLLVTPEIERSTVVRNVELPRLLELAQDPSFTLLVASRIPHPGDPAKVDVPAADRLLRQRRKTLSRLLQWPLFGDGALETIARQMVLRRMEAFAKQGRDEIALEIQTRFEAGAEYSGSPLLVRTPPPEPGRRAPSPETWKPFGAFLASLPHLLRTARARRVVVQGGAHPSVAFALGAALPLPTSWGPHLAVQDQHGRLWKTEAHSAAPPLSSILEPPGPPGHAVAVHVDLLAAPPPVDGFGRYVSSPPSPYSATLRLLLAERRPVDPQEAGALAREIALRIRHLASDHQTRQVHLFLAAPFAIPVLLGQQLNTLEIVLYEWEDGLEPPRYVPAATVASGRGASPIVTPPRAH